MHNCSKICCDWLKASGGSCAQARGEPNFEKTIRASRRETDVCGARHCGLFLGVRAGVLWAIARGMLHVAERLALEPEVSRTARCGSAFWSALASPFRRR